MKITIQEGETLVTVEKPVEEIQGLFETFIATMLLMGYDHAIIEEYIIKAGEYLKEKNHEPTAKNTDTLGL